MLTQPQVQEASMESLLFLACLVAICAIAGWTIANDKREDPLGADTRVPNATAREKGQRSSRFFHSRILPR